MTREEAREWASLYQAYADGKTIQFRSNAEKKWIDLCYGSFDDSIYCYRIKPEPREIWVTEYNGRPVSAHESEREASRYARASGPGVNCVVRYREVIE